MNIAFVNPEYPSQTTRDHGGIATYIYNLSNALADLGHKVFILARKGTVPDLLRPNVSFHTFDNIPVSAPFSFIYRRLWNNIYWERGCSNAAKQALLSIHKKYPIDIVEIPEYHGLAHQFGFLTPFPVVIHFHTPTKIIDMLDQVPVTQSNRMWYRFENRAIKKGTALKCTSESLKSLLKEHCGVSPDKVAVIRNPVPVYPFSSIKKSHSFDKSRINILFSGRLERRKGAEIILFAINDIMNIDSRIHMTFAGQTEFGQVDGYRQAIERSLEKRFRERVWFLGPIDRTRLCKLYCESDIFLMPSLFDNAPNSLFEAMAAKLPVIAGDVGGINEIIRDRENGLLFKIENTSEFVDRIRELITSVEDAKKYALNAYNDVITIYSPGKIAQETAMFYTNVKRAKS